MSTPLSVDARWDPGGGGDLELSGGSAGMGAHLDALAATAHELVVIGLSAADLTALVARLATRGDLPAAVAEGALAHPLTVPGLMRLAAEVEAAQAGIGIRLAVEGVEVSALGVSVAAVVTAYRTADRACAAALDAVEDRLMAGVGLALPVLLVGAAALAAGGVDLPTWADHTAYRHPWLVDVGAGGLDGLLRGLSADAPWGTVLGVAAARAGVPWPPPDEAEATAVLAQVGAMTGALDEDRRFGAVRLEPVTSSRGEAPRNIADLVRGEVTLADPDAPAGVRVVQVPQPDGSSAWVVLLPGTRVWRPRPSADPFDLSTDVEAMAGEATLAAAGAALALDRAMAAADRSGRRDPVMLVGYSQGGILAAAMASDARFRNAHDLTHVVTVGAPVGRFPIPPSVQVLSLEHSRDLVPRLDAVPNPDWASWTTVRRDAESVDGSAIRAHLLPAYSQTANAVDTAIATGGFASLNSWRRSAEPFLRGTPDATTTDYRLVRESRPAG